MSRELSTCKFCQYWYTEEGWTGIGECRFDPPKFYERDRSGWPTSSPDQWCGKWEP
jgi:hypothetical protein